MSRMTSRDGLPFALFCSSVDMRQGLIARGFSNVPKSPNTIRTIVIQYSQKVRQVVVNEMMRDMADEKKFSLTFDEWSSLANKRYMSINVHGVDGKVWSLGLVRVSGSMPADKCVQLVEAKLKENSSSLDKNIVCVTTDGASLMTKVGKSIAPFQQLCFAHGVQVGILDVLYKKAAAVEVDEAEAVDARHDTIAGSVAAVSPKTASADQQVAIDESEGVELSMDVEEIGETGGVMFLEDDDLGADVDLRLQVFPELVDNFDCVIRKVRKIVCMFKSSPTRNDTLQKHVQDDFGKQLPLLLDTKTRWSSLCTMLERFYFIRDAVRKAVIDLKLQSSVALSDEEIEQIRTVVQVLQVVQLTVEALCRRDATRLTADAALRFMLTKLRAENTNLSHDLAIALSRRIGQRRNKLTGVLTYLHNPNAVDPDDADEDSDVFSMPPIAEIRKIIKELVQRLQASNDTGTQLTPVGDSGEVSNRQCEVMQTNNEATKPTTVKQLSVEQELQQAILASTCAVIKTPSCSTSQELMKVIRQEMTLFENGGNRGRYLQLVYDYLLSIPPTSVEAERAFSASGLICSRLRTRLGDETLDALCFLRSYFQKQHLNDAAA